MKNWFKYEFGYVNIDDENIYFTNTGNWSEISGLTEKTKKVSRKNKLRETRILLFLIPCLILFFCLFTCNLLSSRTSLLLMVGLPTLAYFLYNYLKTETGSKYALPVSKLISIESDQKDITIHFMNGENKKDSELLTNVEQKGFDLLNTLMEINQQKPQSL